METGQQNRTHIKVDEDAEEVEEKGDKSAWKLLGKSSKIIMDCNHQYWYDGSRKQSGGGQVSISQRHLL